MQIKPLKNIKDLGMTIPGRKRAPELRSNYISLYQSQLDIPTCRNIDKTDSMYNLLAYQMMTDTEILLSERREYEFNVKGLDNLQERLERVERRSRGVSILVGARKSA